MKYKHCKYKQQRQLIDSMGSASYVDDKDIEK